ncbi:hypothetical protein [Brevundimonas sp. G8]|uniref:hypothetical protein n=1 Tax=Brevundimonas sp. G8 TaxID=1350776 RepID=UPI0012F3D4D4|nr:hypothetical protein [Brevundimonas sp. G8]VXB41756.1 conserved hypothetical protein [Brevundimonas sp. G8]
MTKFVVDLNSKVIAPEQKIWVVHPGRVRSHADTFLSENAIFLEFPGLTLRPSHLQDDNALRQSIRQSGAVKSNKGFVRSDGSPILLSDFAAAAGTDVSVHLRTVKHLTNRMMRGDLVVVPTRGAGGQVLFGEVSGDFFPQQVIRVPSMPYADVPVRRVKWLQNRLKSDLPSYLVRYFEKPPAIAEVARDKYTESFFDYAYDAYSTASTSWVSVNAPSYDGSDFLGAVAPAQLIALAVALFNAAEKHADVSQLSYDQIVTAFYDENALADAQLKFMSPGRYNLKDRDARLAKFINAFIALALAGALSACGASGNSVAAENSQSPNDPATGDLTAMIGLATKAPKAVLTRAENQAADSKKKLGLSVPAKVK